MFCGVARLVDEGSIGGSGLVRKEIRQMNGGAAETPRKGAEQSDATCMLMAIHL